MNKFYDKLLLAVALIALLAAIAFYVMKSGAMPADATQMSVQAADNPYIEVPFPQMDSSEATWPEPEEQSSNWVYDVFTPPKIFIDENGNFTVTPWKITNDEPFGVYLAEMKRDPYRIQIQGYIEEVINDPTQSLILLYDEELQKSVRVRIGSEVATSQFKVLDFQIDRINNPDGSIEKVASVTILDQRAGEEVTLKHGERRFESGITVVIRSEEYPSVEIMLTEAPASFETPMGSYSLMEINLEESSVTVKKLGDEEREAQLEELFLQTSTQSEDNDESTDMPDSDSTTSDDTFDFVF